MSSEKAIGAPSAMAPSSANRKVAIVMKWLLAYSPTLPLKGTSSSRGIRPVS